MMDDMMRHQQGMMNRMEQMMGDAFSDPFFGGGGGGGRGAAAAMVVAAAARAPGVVPSGGAPLPPHADIPPGHRVARPAGQVGDRGGGGVMGGQGQRQQQRGGPELDFFGGRSMMGGFGGGGFGGGGFGGDAFAGMGGGGGQSFMRSSTMMSDGSNTYRKDMSHAQSGAVSETKLYEGDSRSKREVVGLRRGIGDRVSLADCPPAAS